MTKKSRVWESDASHATDGSLPSSSFSFPILSPLSQPCHFPRPFPLPSLPYSLRRNDAVLGIKPSFHPYARNVTHATNATQLHIHVTNPSDATGHFLVCLVLTSNKGVFWILHCLRKAGKPGCSLRESFFQERFKLPSAQQRRFRDILSLRDMSGDNQGLFVCTEMF